MTKNYLESSFNKKQNLEVNPKKQTISFLLSYSQSFKIEQQSKHIKNIRLDKN
ncbi:hypothetical protein ACXGQW_01775 [Wenyingzhuangia sp. IMCC45533]